MDGEHTEAAVVEGTDGNFYGTTVNGGAPINTGTAFKITPSGRLTTLHSFFAEGAIAIAGDKLSYRGRERAASRRPE